MGAINRFPSGGGGSKINGIIEEYKVAAGANVSAGDFVSFIQEYVGETEVTEGLYIPKYASSSSHCIAATELDDNRVFMCFGHYSTESTNAEWNNAIVGVIVTFDGVNMSYVTKVLDNTYYPYAVPDVCKVGEDKVMVAFRHRPSNTSSNSGHLIVCMVDTSGNDMTSTTTAVDSGSFICMRQPQIVLLSTSQVFIVTCNGSSTVSETMAYGYLIEIDGLEVSQLAKQYLTSSMSWSGDNRYTYTRPSAVLVSEGNVLVSWANAAYDICNILVKVVNDQIVVAFGTIITDIPTNAYRVCLCKLSENRVALSFLGSSSYSYTYCSLYEISDTGMTAIVGFTNISLSGEKFDNSRYFETAVTDEDKFVLIAMDTANSYTANMLFVNINNSGITIDRKVTLSATHLPYYTIGSEGNFGLVVRSNGSIFTSYNSSDSYIMGYLTNKVFEPTVATYDTSRAIRGVAKGSGAAGEAIEVTIPEATA